MAVHKAWIVIACLLLIVALPACASNDTDTMTGPSSSSTGAGGDGAGGADGGVTDAGMDGSDGSDGSVAVCGDAKLAATELCDDGNTVDGDGCSSTCTVEKGWSCKGEPAKCSAICGDGQILGEELCDDGNTRKGDGCNVRCEVEEGWTCDGASPTKCATSCGDGVIAGKEECDDGNTDVDDGCNASCIVELGYSCVGVPSHCDAQCGDGFKTKGEECDDDNFKSGDGCSSECKVEEFWTCTDMPGEPTACVTPCGDGNKVGKETCDDGNTASGDGCSDACTAEFGWTCDGTPSLCLTTCGDGKIAGAEKCDDGNKAGNDGCSINCKVEPGWSCTQNSPVSASVCATACGDGFPIGGEQCDDGNHKDGDGCSATCQSEPGWTCVGIPSTCVAICGDGIVTGDEQCDDLNTDNTDGCSADCKIQPGWNCTTVPGMGSTCESVCGDGIVVGSESCDDGNTLDGDCCSSTCGAESACEIEVNDSPSLANDFDLLSSGGIIKGNIKPAGDIDVFSFSVAPNVTIALTAETIDGPTSACVANGQDSTITIYGSDGQIQLATDDNSGPGNCAAVTAARLDGGPNGADYFIEVKSSVPGKTFDYGLKLTPKITVCGNGVKEPGEQCDDGNTAAGDGCDATCLFETYSEIEPNNTPADATANGPFPINSLWTGSIGVIGDIDIFRMDVVKAVDLTIETFDGTGPGNCTGIDTEIGLFASNGTTQLASDDDDGVGTCSLITAMNDVGARHLLPGTYFVNVHRFSNSQTIPAYMAVVTPTATCGNGVKEGFEECDGTANCSPNCDIMPFCGDGTISANEQCDDGNTINGDGCSSACLVEGVTQEVEPNDTFAQANGLTAFNGSGTVGGSINPSGEKDIYRVNVAATSVIRFETFDRLNFDCLGIATKLTLFDGSGTQLKIDSPDAGASGIGNCAALIVRLDPGAYYIQVEKVGNGTIPFYLLEVSFLSSRGNEIEPNDSQATATPLSGLDVFTFGDHQVGTDLDFYSISVPAGKSIRIEIIEGDATLPCEGVAIDSFIALFSPTGTQLVSDDDDGRGRCSAIDGTGATPRDAAAHNLPAGTYFIQAKAFTTTNAQFNYNLAITIR